MSWTHIDKTHSACLAKLETHLFWRAEQLFQFEDWQEHLKIGVRSFPNVLCRYMHICIQTSVISSSGLWWKSPTKPHSHGAGCWCSPGFAPGQMSQRAGPSRGSWCQLPSLSSSEMSTSSYESCGKPCSKSSSGPVWVCRSEFWILSFSAPELLRCIDHDTACTPKGNQQYQSQFLKLLRLSTPSWKTPQIYYLGPGSWGIYYLVSSGNQLWPLFEIQCVTRPCLAIPSVLDWDHADERRAIEAKIRW